MNSGVAHAQVACNFPDDQSNGFSVNLQEDNCEVTTVRRIDDAHFVTYNPNLNEAVLEVRPNVPAALQGVSQITVNGTTKNVPSNVLADVQLQQFPDNTTLDTSGVHDNGTQNFQFDIVRANGQVSIEGTSRVGVAGQLVATSGAIRSRLFLESSTIH
ncbi:hypothetical protein [Pseudovibrio brasiliensis]|uniref:Auto-transporter adhesin head GIN domain-containing protein n=1 Tax=Pseudovibrio brasiliensis TaxID=1898042 RepID=A0ABX8ARR8_9HYPH|nr:hypothetical protein [Pseudovibrio brasiliensis]QUS56545.1 hypothetical protein KGB56_03655 [Pseudovibrio brasiliensis]